MDGLWLSDMECLEAISQDDTTRKIFLKMARMSRDGKLGGFLQELEGDAELDDRTKSTLAELANDRAFLIAVEDYLYRTHHFH